MSRRRARAARRLLWTAGVAAALLGAAHEASRKEPALWLVLVVMASVVLGALIVLEVLDHLEDDDEEPPRFPKV